MCTRDTFKYYKIDVHIVNIVDKSDKTAILTLLNCSTN